MRVIIFANGELRHPQRITGLIEEGDVLIAADGGARHCLSLGLSPGLVVGDFDSLTEDELRHLEQAGAELSRHPKEKDETDLELALLEAKRFDPEEIIIFGALGARWDMSVANLMLLAHPYSNALDLRIVDGPQELSLLQSGRTKELGGQPGDTVSLIPLVRDATGITTQGLAYPLENGTLRFGASRGVSNEMLAERAAIHLTEGLLLIVHIQPKRLQTPRSTGCASE